MPLITRRAPQPDDLDFYHAYRTNAQIALAEGRTPDTSQQVTQSHLTALLAGNGSTNFSWVILRESQPIGNIAIWGFNAERTTAELAYGLLPQAQGHGYMAVALDQTIQFAFTKLHLQQLDCYTAASNTPSRRLLEHHGFQFQRYISEENLVGTLTKMAVYAISANNVPRETLPANLLP